METERIARLFRNGQNQAVRIPREWELPGDTVLLHREGQRLVIEPLTKKPRLLDVLAGIPPGLDFPPVEDAPVTPENIF